MVMNITVHNVLESNSMCSNILCTIQQIENQQRFAGMFLQFKVSFVTQNVHFTPDLQKQKEPIILAGYQI